MPSSEPWPRSLTKDDWPELPPKATEPLSRRSTTPTRKRIFNFCLRLVGSQEDAADATQDAFVKVLQRLPKITGELNFGAYLFTAARNASYDIIGKRKRAEPVEEIGDVTGRPLHGDERGHIDVDPERAALLAALQESVQAANAKLPERQREVLALRELDDMSYDEIAAVMDMNRNSVAQLISRARIKLRDELVGSALASVSAATPDCQKALPLIAMRQDGQLKDAGDKQWLKDHIADCTTCKVSVEAMEEAGVSYRAWAPIVPLLWLRKATIARAADRCGFDWSEVADSPRGGDGSSGGEGGTGSGSGGGSGASAGVGAGAVAGTVGGLTVAADAKTSDRGHHVRRAILAVLGIALIAVLFLQLLPGDDGNPSTAAKRAAQTSPIVTPLPIVAAVVHHKRHEVHHKAHKAVHKAKHHKRKHHKHHKKTTVVVASGGTTTTVTPTTTVAQVVTSAPVHHHTTTTHHHTTTTPTHKTTTKTTTIHATGGGSGVKTTTTHATRPTPPPVTTTTTQAAPPPPPPVTTTTTTDVTPPPVTTTTTTTTTQPQLPKCPPAAVAPPPGRCMP